MHDFCQLEESAVLREAWNTISVNMKYQLKFSLKHTEYMEIRILKDQSALDWWHGQY